MSRCYQFTVKGRPITKKNSQRMVQNKKTKKWFPIPSKAYAVYEKSCLNVLREQAPQNPIDCPVNIRCRYFMPTYRACDLANLIEATTDILVKAKVIADDNYKIVSGHDGSRVYVDKGDPRVEITIEEIEL